MTSATPISPNDASGTGASPRDALARPNGVARLVLASASGLWVVTSTSATRYYLDLDAGLLLRQPGDLSATGPFDGTWVHLVQVTNLNGTGVVQVGFRHKYDLDPDRGGSGDYIWWVQRLATGIHPVLAADRPAGQVPGADEYAKPFAHHRPESRG